MQNRIKTLEATKAYADAFNNQDVVKIADILDDDCIFSRQEQNSVIGKENVLRRIRNLFWRAEEQHKSLHVVQAIVDLGQSKARPCLITLVNDVPVALCVLSCKYNGHVNGIAILLSGDMVSAARPTEKMPGQEQDDDGADNDKRADLLAVTKSYISHFNNRDLSALGDLLDPTRSVFHRSDQRAIVGRDPILSRIRDLYKRVDKHGQSLVTVNAIIDVAGKTAWPCTLGVLDGAPVSVGLLKLNKKGLISTIHVNLAQDLVEKARPTEPMPEVKAKTLTLDQVLEREEWLHARHKKIKKAMKKHGNLPHLITKEMRVEQQLQKIDYLKKKLKN